MWCIFCVNGILTGNATKIPPPNCLFMLLVYFRAWQRKLNALVKDLQQRAHMYACLWMLINEESKEKFYERLHIFISYWCEKQPKFIEYFEAEYTPRTGNIQIIIVISNNAMVSIAKRRTLDSYTHIIILTTPLMQRSGLSATVTSIMHLLKPICLLKGWRI